jgi:hypothetical protein
VALRGRGAHLTPRLHPVPTLRMNKSVSQFYHMSSWHAETRLALLYQCIIISSRVQPLARKTVSDIRATADKRLTMEQIIASPALRSVMFSCIPTYSTPKCTPRFRAQKEKRTSLHCSELRIAPKLYLLPLTRLGNFSVVSEMLFFLIFFDHRCNNSPWTVANPVVES